MDIDELSDLIKLHGKAIYGFCHKLAGNKADADDLYQETFLKAMEVRHKIDASKIPRDFSSPLRSNCAKTNAGNLPGGRGLHP
ncbi:RNA polymerase sigma factor [Paenibacillus mendelii]|uniref:RNA polymerase sigma factor n=1 Tax=Paenibacillus mendelii TaxID=206163 RepID=A0ABV6J287_9BACL|nr:sigma-70 family RNA polymerase sigma factor [Paenibacillus mendelii]